MECATSLLSRHGYDFVLAYQRHSRNWGVEKAKSAVHMVQAVSLLISILTFYCDCFGRIEWGIVGVIGLQHVSSGMWFEAIGVHGAFMITFVFDWVPQSWSTRFIGFRTPQGLYLYRASRVWEPLLNVWESLLIFQIPLPQNMWSSDGYIST